MKYHIFFINLLISAYVSGMDQAGKLTVVNNHEGKVYLWYSPTLIGLDQTMPVRCFSELRIAPQQTKTTNTALLFPFVDIRAFGFEEIEKLPVKVADQLVVNKELNGRISITQGEREIAVLKKR